MLFVRNIMSSGDNETGDPLKGTLTACVEPDSAL